MSNRFAMVSFNEREPRRAFQRDLRTS
jgi:hypothetical protein